jgi:hypothetical protein
MRRNVATGESWAVVPKVTRQVLQCSSLFTASAAPALYRASKRLPEADYANARNWRCEILQCPGLGASEVVLGLLLAECRGWGGGSSSDGWRASASEKTVRSGCPTAFGPVPAAGTTYLGPREGATHAVASAQPRFAATTRAESPVSSAKTTGQIPSEFKPQPGGDGR